MGARDARGRFAPKACIVQGCTQPVERWADGRPRPRCVEHRRGHAADLAADMAAIESKAARS